jgi:hypothetical protein
MKRQVMAIHNGQWGTLAGTAGGTLLSIWASIQGEDVVKTMLLACIGATTSFFISLLMKELVRRLRR